jgi:hypothetical protein
MFHLNAVGKQPEFAMANEVIVEVSSGNLHDVVFVWSVISCRAGVEVRPKPLLRVVVA